MLELSHGAPLNLELPLRAFPGEVIAPRLERVADGAIIATTVVRLEILPYWWLGTVTDLSPNTEYRLVRADGSTTQFVTGKTRDNSSPTLDNVTVLPSEGNDKMCGESVGAQLALSGVADGRENAPMWVEIEAEVGVAARTVFAPYNPGGLLALGHSKMGCFGTSELPALAHGQVVSTRVRLHDASGNASAWQSLSVPMAADAFNGGQVNTEVPGGAVEDAQAPIGPSEPTQNGLACSMGVGKPRAPSTWAWAILAMLSAFAVRRNARG